MAFKPCSSNNIALFFTLNLLFFALVSGCGYKCPNPKPKPNPNPNPNNPNPNPNNPNNPNPNPNNPNPNPNPNNPNPNPNPNNPNNNMTCPRDALKLGICANVLSGLLNITLGQPPVTPCCSLLSGLVDLEAAICLCTALRGNILGININLPISLSLLLNVCSRQVPRGFQCS
ncbi:hypothetical protein HN51_062386 [Arachis hypogaea]|uniref:Bifunctional inhibitor/plant lipid transfer protein/seed storage helical domain-containing protein n=2 Tax=Arachis hypogaea TaxID=3818 RepID=A0A445ASI9_ARAHY|nr:lipid transfer protein EARLI 1 [Arachis ipaensis]XP_025627714.1 lipid transfer protein EARLI 1-like [Arachis hypogaea]QHO19856.1 pEARLI1-like lipid transfer protein [Arachis hypogaea]RYR29408.1 hypothetical protein Ahy_B01g053774 isoform H [Arachis hypogaea]